MIDTLKYLTARPEIGLSQTVQKVRCEAQTSDKNIGKSCHPPSALSTNITVEFYG